MRGAAYSGMGDHENAIIDLTRAIELQPENYNIYIFRGMAHLNLQHLQEARGDFSIASKLHPESEVPYLKSGLCDLAIGDTLLAIEHFSIAVTINPRYGEAYYQRGLVYSVLPEKMGEACADFEKADALGYIKAYDLVKKLCQDKQIENKEP